MREHIRWESMRFLIFTLLLSSVSRADDLFENTSYENKKKKIEYYLITAQPVEAQAILNSNRYLFKNQGTFDFFQSIISFIEKDYQQAATSAANAKANGDRSRALNCQILVISKLLSKNWDNLYYDWKECKVISRYFNDDDQLWMGLLAEYYHLKTDVFTLSRYNSMLESEDSLRRWLKASLYTKKADQTEPYTLNLPVEMYKNAEIKDLTSQILYQQKKILFSYELIQGSVTHHEKLINGNLFFLKGDKEKAKEFFLEALKENPFSKHALRSLINISFMDGDLENSMKYIAQFLEFFKDPPADLYWKKSLIHLSQGQLVNAERAMNHYRSLLPLIERKRAHQILKYFHLVNNNEKEAKYYSELSCQNKDESGCWLSLFMDQNIENLNAIKAQFTSVDEYDQWVRSPNYITAGPVDSYRFDNQKSPTQIEIYQRDQAESVKDLFFQQ